MEIFAKYYSEKSAILLPWILLGSGFCLLYIPTVWTLMHGLWGSEQQGHGPIVLMVCIWLFWRKRIEVAGAVFSSSKIYSWVLLLAGCLIYALGRSQGILILEVGSSLFLVAGSVLLLRGPAALRLLWFPVFFMLFLLPLPISVVDALTQPMKMAVSWVAEFILFHAGYPIARTGVMLQVGAYQLLVADACAGLQTLFTLEAMGLLYLNIVRHSSLLRNVGLAILIIPISFVANVVRVCILILVTYHFGDAAGQGFLHGFSGLVLFVVALLLIIGMDSLLRFTGNRGAAHVA
ncbi:exosortase B [Craterilacuibacter sp. RT1T]|uniref:exosortase B n=1 Tax=Craterilacuibacter sp. RT1T TaxID=2942211 RepID=UPI0020C0267D|nr:exosortase B [Craterilacuibacter sp. RT1T]MCL6262739.1 exosortase B [Craterilacuibacter sp. RT1T]